MKKLLPNNEYSVFTNTKNTTKANNHSDNNCLNTQSSIKSEHLEDMDLTMLAYAAYEAILRSLEVNECDKKNKRID